MAVDFRPRYKDYAVFCPAISSMYVNMESNKNMKRPMPAGMQQSDLNFLDENCPLYHIPYSLYSAGQASKSDSTVAKADMITTRNRSNTTLIGDSGGFQIKTNSIKFRGDSTVNRLMKWLETTSDWSMILDFPPSSANMTEHTTRIAKELKEQSYTYKHNGKKYVITKIEDFANVIGYTNPDSYQLTFAACLLQTIRNNEYFLKHRTKGKTKFLNVLQGRNLAEANIWYEHVKKFQFEAWSVSGPHRENFVMLMSRIIDMCEDGLLQNKDWMHILGMGRLANGCVYTTIQHCIREDINPNFTISYDVSSPFTSTAFGNILMGYTLDNSGWTLQMGKFDDKDYVVGHSKANLPFLDGLKNEYNKKGLVSLEQGGSSRFVETEIGKRLKASDICINNDPEKNSTWDTLSYALLMNHNLQVHLTGVFEAQDLYDKGDLAHVPAGLLRLKELIPQIFQCYKNEGYNAAKAMIFNNANDLNFLAGGIAKEGVPDYSHFVMPEPLAEKIIKVKKTFKEASFDSELFEEQ